jgi:hypothetical protein
MIEHEGVSDLEWRIAVTVHQADRLGVPRSRCLGQPVGAIAERHPGVLAARLQGLAVAANLLSLWSQHEVAQSLFEATLARTPLPAAAANVFGGVVTASQVMAAVVTPAARAVPGWIMRRLMSPTVRQHFA